MKEPRLTDAQRALMTLMRTPHADGGMKMLKIVRAIEGAEEADRLDLMSLFMQASCLDRRDEPPLTEPLLYTHEEMKRAVHAYELCLANGTIEYQSILNGDLPVRAVAARMLRQLELLRPFGLLTQAWFLDQVIGHPKFPYVEPGQLPQPANRSSQQLLVTLEHRPALFARLYRTVAAYFDSPVDLGGCIRQLLVDEPDHVIDAAIGWAYGMRQQFQRRAAQRTFRELMFSARPKTLSPVQEAELAAREMTATDKKKLD